MPTRHAVAPLAELPPGGGRAFTIAGKELAVFNVGGKIFAIDGICPHAGAPLAEGSLEGTVLTCPWHGAGFELSSGEVLCPPAVENVRSYPAFVVADRIEVEL